MKKNDFTQYIGNQAQIGGTRHYLLTDGWARGLRAVDVNSGKGLEYTIIPDRGMDISLARYKGMNLVYLTSNGETHPSFFEPEDLGWLRTFAGGLLTTCGLTYLGGPVTDGSEHLGLHGRFSTIPARQVADLSGWIDDEYIIKVRGVVEEAVIFGNKLRLEREISTILGHNKIIINDRVTNFGNQPSPYTILYHMNLGYPLLCEDSELIIDPENTVPRDATAEEAMKDFRKFSKPVTGFREQVFFHKMRADINGLASAALLNKKMGIALTIRFDPASLPYLTEWKMLGAGDYVLGLEPCNVQPKNRKTLREENILPLLEAGETRTNKIEVTITEL
jgi:galactose mutarotase-like enzyme